MKTSIFVDSNAIQGAERKWFDPQSEALLYNKFTIDVFRLGAALVLIATLLLTPNDSLFYPISGTQPQPKCDAYIHSFSVYCLGFFPEGVVWPLAISLAILFLVLIGLYPRYVSFLHWWVTWSFSVSSNLVDGGDQLVSNLLFLCFIISLTDSRVFIWTKNRPITPTSNPFLVGISYSAYILFLLQMAGVYLQSTVAKMAVDEWITGSAFWYWGQTSAIVDDSSFFYRIFIEPVFMNKWGSVLISYATLALQMFLFVAIFLSNFARKIALLLAVPFHIGIALVMGLWSFSVIMILADVVIYRRPDLPLKLKAKEQ